METTETHNLVKCLPKSKKLKYITKIITSIESTYCEGLAYNMDDNHDENNSEDIDYNVPYNWRYSGLPHNLQTIVISFKKDDYVVLDLIGPDRDGGDEEQTLDGVDCNCSCKECRKYKSDHHSKDVISLGAESIKRIQNILHNHKLGTSKEDVINFAQVMTYVLGKCNLSDCSSLTNPVVNVCLTDLDKC